ncbi:MAG: hypothetical protein QMD00_01265 [Hadesarchaea archaeon]|nr:hypothetical protein [Hadesarchaea archaeon]
MRFGKRSGETTVFAEHGRWIARLRDDVKVLDQRLHSLERRVSTIEANLAELAKLYGKLDLVLSKIDDELKRWARGRRR